MPQDFEIEKKLRRARAALYYDDQTMGVKQSHVKRLRQILALLTTAYTVEDMNVPGLKLHQLKGD